MNPVCIMMQVTRPTKRVKHIMVMYYQSMLDQLPGAVGNINMYLFKEVNDTLCLFAKQTFVRKHHT
jgi:hypothetical protein